MTSDAELAIAFLRSIGLTVKVKRGATGFLPACRISHGTLLVDPSCSAGEMLHDAGHLAITPTPWRQLCDDDVTAAHVRMFDDLRTRDEMPDSPLYRAALQTSEPEAIAWAWAAGVHLGLAPEAIIEDIPGGYDGDPEPLRLALGLRAHLGINGLAFAGMTSTNGLGGLPVYPRLAFWTQPISG